MSLSREQIATARSFLFVPGDRPDRFAKAASSGADVVIVDLEDAVAGEDKSRARAHVEEWLGAGRDVAVRINPPGTPWFESDLAAVTAHSCPVVVPKAESVPALSDIGRQVAGKCELIPLVESALGVARASEVCATAGTVRVAFGNVDLASELGIAHDDRTALIHARSRIVFASAAANLAPPVDGVTTSVADAGALDADVAHARRLGFTGKLCIHPRQVAAVVSGFAPTEADQAWANQVVAAGESVTQINGQMIDKPLLERARRILAACRDR